MTNFVQLAFSARVFAYVCSVGVRSVFGRCSVGVRSCPIRSCAIAALFAPCGHIIVCGYR